jgi:hypothetical protein
VVVAEAPDDQTIAAQVLGVAGRGIARTARHGPCTPGAWALRCSGLTANSPEKGDPNR